MSERWEPISKSDLLDLIATGESAMDTALRERWVKVRIEPEKWSLSPWGDMGGGFWVVAVLGKQVVWYNDIEDGFNVSQFEAAGTIGEYWCDQDELQHVIYRLFVDS